MKIGMRMPPMGSQMGIEKLAAWAAENALAAIDTGPLTPEIVKALEKNGLAIGTVDVPATAQTLSANEDTRRKGLAEQKESMSRSADLGAKIFFVALTPEDPSLGRGKNFEIFRQVYQEVVAHVDSLGASIAMEPWPGGAPHFGNLGCTPETWRAIFEVCPSPNMGICFDPSHLVRMGIDPLRALHEFGPRIKHAHAKDTAINEQLLYEHGIYGPSFDKPYRYGEGWWRYCIPGDGKVDWNQFIARLLDEGFDGILSIELEDHRYTPEQEKQKAGIIAARKHLELCMAKGVSGEG